MHAKHTCRRQPGPGPQRCLCAMVKAGPLGGAYTQTTEAGKGETLKPFMPTIPGVVSIGWPPTVHHPTTTTILESGDSSTTALDQSLRQARSKPNASASADSKNTGGQDTASQGHQHPANHNPPKIDPTNRRKRGPCHIPN